MICCCHSLQTATICRYEFGWHLLKPPVEGVRSNHLLELKNHLVAGVRLDPLTIALLSLTIALLLNIRVLLLLLVQQRSVFAIRTVFATGNA